MNKVDNKFQTIKLVEFAMAAPSMLYFGINIKFNNMFIVVANNNI